MITEDLQHVTFTFTFICHPGKTHNLRSRGDTSRRAQTHNTLLVVDVAFNTTRKSPDPSRAVQHNAFDDGAPPPGFFWLFAIRELVSNKPCVILAAGPRSILVGEW